MSCVRADRDREGNKQTENIVGDVFSREMGDRPCDTN